MKYFLIVIALLFSSFAEAQTSRNPCYTTGNGINGMPNCIGVGTSTPLPVTATITPSGTQNVNLNQVLGAAPSLTNPIFVTPATGATFSTTGPSTGGGFPNSATPLTATGIGTTAATTATLTASASKFTYICGFTISADATTALAAAATVTGTVTGSLNYIQNVGAATAAGILTQTFNPCIPSSAVNTAIVVTSAAAGLAGNTAVNAWGYQQ